MFKINKIQNAILILILFLSFVSIARGEYLKTYIELTGGYGGVAMTQWNKDVDNYNAQAINSGNIPLSEPINSENQFGITILSDFSIPFGTFAGYLNYEYMSVYQEDRVVIEPNVARTVETVMLRPSYIGLGCRYIYPIITNNESSLRIFCGIDAGSFFTYGYYKWFGYLSDGSEYYWNNMQFDQNESLYLGGNVYTGMDLWLSKWIGINASLGYRKANGFVNETCIDNSDKNIINTKGSYQVDYSGFYIKGGLSICLW